MCNQYTCLYFKQITLKPLVFTIELHSLSLIRNPLTLSRVSINRTDILSTLLIDSINRIRIEVEEKKQTRMKPIEVIIVAMFFFVELIEFCEVSCFFYVLIFITLH